MANTIKVLVYPVKDVEKAEAFYTRFLETEPYVASPYYVGFKVGDQEVGLDPNSKLGPIAYIDVKDLKASLQEMTKVGAEIIQEPKNVADGLWIAQIKDSNGNVVGLREQKM